jgi:hypothetical protein
MKKVMTSNNSHLTAIGRKQIPSPTAWLVLHGFICPQETRVRILDYGCGRCHSVNNTIFKADGYDPYYRPKGLPVNKKYEIILCNYVLCTLTESEGKEVLKEIHARLSQYGAAYITVRRAKPHHGWGVSSKGTFQRLVRLNLYSVYKNSQFEIYRLTKFNDIDNVVACN